MQIFRGGDGAHAAVNESNENQKACDRRKKPTLLAVSLYAQRRIHSGPHFQECRCRRAESNSRVRPRTPSSCRTTGKPCCRGEIQRLIGNGTFRWPQTGRSAAKKFFVIVARAAQLFRRHRPDIEMQGRVADNADLKTRPISESHRSGRHRMIERRGGKFDLAAFGSAAVIRAGTSRKSSSCLARNSCLSSSVEIRAFVRRGA